MYWEKETQDFGTVRKNTTKVINFKAKEGMPEIAHMYGSCGCTKMQYNAATKVLAVRYEAGDVPKHLGNSNQRIFKTITIVYKDNTTQVLTITGIKTH